MGGSVNMSVFDILREKIKEKYEKVNPYVEKNVAEIINEVEKEFATEYGTLTETVGNGYLKCEVSSD